MRRSAAPSQGLSRSLKKRCFCVPYGPNLHSYVSESQTNSSRLNDSHREENKESNTLVSPTEKDARSVLDVLRLLTKEPSKSDTTDLPADQQNDAVYSNEDVSKTKVQLEDRNLLSLNNNITSSKRHFLCNDEPYEITEELCPDSQISTSNGLESTITKYFNVMWCKLSKKKHKKWEGDGIMIVKGRTVILQSLEGKEISRRAGCKLQEVLSLDEGQRIIVGSKECEIQHRIEKNDFMSGRCFLSNAKESKENDVPKSMKHGLSVPLLPASKKPQTQKHRSFFFQRSSDALVMPRPSNSHQWMYNKSQLPVADVSIQGNLANQLRPHQKEGIMFLYECILDFKNFGGNGAILADEMGLGKTLQCIALIWMLHKQGPYGGKPVLKKTIIITPSSLVKNWLKEFHKWLGKDGLSIFTVDKQNKVKEFTQQSHYAVLLISYEMYLRNHELLSDIQFDLIVCDEGHRLKNTNIKTTNIITGLPTPRRIVLTGTPVQNDLQEFYSIVEFCNPGLLGTSSQFHRVFEKAIVRSRQPDATTSEKELGNDRAEELFCFTSKFILRRTQEIITKFLPNKVEHVVFCRPTVLQVSLYKLLLQSRDFERCLSSYASLEGCCHLMCIAAIRKLCNHPLLLYSKELESEQTEEAWNLDSLYQQIAKGYPKNFNSCELEESSGKLRVLSQLLAAMYSSKPREKIVLVSCFTQTLNILQQFCVNKSYKFLRLDGSTPTSDRQKIVEKFNSANTDYFIFLLSSKAGGVGLNLIGASRILLFDIDWNPANDLQAMARIWRDGQRKQVFIYRLITAGTIEEKIFQRQIMKQNLSVAVTDCKSSGKIKFSLEDLKDLFSFHEEALCSTHELLNCRCLDFCDSLNKAEANERSDDNELHLWQLHSQKQYPSLSKKNAGMTELLNWDHIPGLQLNLHNHCDSQLLSCQNDITFVFCSQVKEAII